MKTETINKILAGLVLLIIIGFSVWGWVQLISEKEAVVNTYSLPADTIEKEDLYINIDDINNESADVCFIDNIEECLE